MAKRKKGLFAGRGILVRAFILFLAVFFLCPGVDALALGPQDVLILVNADSHTSRYIANMYRQFYPQIQDWQVLELHGLTDCSGPASTAADEILTRQQYETLIAQPLRAYLLEHNLQTSVKVLITTAGMPYRIRDTYFSDVVTPGASNPSTVANNLAQINAASVESELTCLWYTQAFGTSNRIVNPYHGYRQSGISRFPRVEPGSKPMNWTTALTVTGVAPKMEGQTSWDWPNICYGTFDRSFHAGDIYLTARLDGPKRQGQSAIFAVRRMLERSRRASNPNKGVNPAAAVVVLDDAPNSPHGNLDRNRIFNLDGSVNYVVYDPTKNQPPDACRILLKDDYIECYTALTGGPLDMNGFNAALSTPASGVCVILDRRSNVLTNQSDLDALVQNPALQRQGPQGLLALACFGRNGDEGVTKDYLLTGGPGGGPLYNLVNGAVFTSIESFNAVTMFSNVSTSQAKVIDFIAIGGSGAIGHSFEPVSESIVDNLYFFYNYLADEDGDGFADLTFVEAAFTAIPFLSWSEVVIGDPLMRVAYGPGEFAWEPLPGDVNNDDRVNTIDVSTVRWRSGSALYSSNPEEREMYCDQSDFNQDGIINTIDVATVRYYNGTFR